MQISVTISEIPDLSTPLSKAVIKANDQAVEAGAVYILQQLQPAIPENTGQMKRQLGIKLFRFGKARILAASVRVIGNRAFVMHILEYGAQSHGGTGTKGRKVPPGAFGDRGPISARKTFETVYARIQHAVVTKYAETFYRSLGQAKIL